MFTGLVETVGEVLERKVTPGGVRLNVRENYSPRGSLYQLDA